MAHFTVAASEATFRRLFSKLRDGVRASKSGSGGGSNFRYTWEAGFELRGGTVDLQSSNSVLISELDIVYKPLKLRLEIDIPEICIGGFCIIPKPWPWSGCLLRAPKICVFSRNPDIVVPLDLGGIIQSEISGAFRIKTRYFTSPLLSSTVSYLDAEDRGQPSEWQFYLDPIWLDIDPIDVSDTIGNILETIINNAINSLLGWLPGWAKDVLRWIFGNIIGFIRRILDIADDLDEWLSNLLGISIGLVDWVATVVADYFARRYPILKVEDPYPILDYDGILIPVKVPLLNMGVNITDTEMVLTADVGATL